MIFARQDSNGTAVASSSAGPSRVPGDAPKSQSKPLTTASSSSSSSLAPSRSPTATPAQTTTAKHVLPEAGHTTVLPKPNPVMLTNGTASALDDAASASSAVPSPSASTAIEEEEEDMNTATRSPLTTPATPVPPTPYPHSGLRTERPIAYTSLPPAASSSGATAGGSSGLLTTGELIGAIVGGSAVVLTLIGLCVFCGLRRRRRSRSHEELNDDMMPPPAFQPSRRVSRRGWPATDEYASAPAATRPMTQVTLPEARDSVQTRPAPELFAPPMRTHPAFTSRASRVSAWTDNSEADAVAHDGSTIARTLSTVSRPNSEYDLENDPGATYGYTWQRPAPGTPGTFGLPASNSFGPYTHSVENSLDLGPNVLAGGAYAHGHAHAHTHTRQPSAGYSTNGYSSNGYSSAYATYASGSSGASYPLVPQQGRVPAPRLLLDTKMSLDQSGPSSAATMSPYSAGASAGSEYLERAYAGQPSRQAEYSQLISPTGTERSSAFGTLGGAGTNMSSGSGSGLKRGPTIIRHADAGAFADAIPDEQGENIHLPPAYGDIYGPPA